MCNCIPSISIMQPYCNCSSKKWTFKPLLFSYVISYTQFMLDLPQCPATATSISALRAFCRQLPRPNRPPFPAEPHPHLLIIRIPPRPPKASTRPVNWPRLPGFAIMLSNCNSCPICLCRHSPWENWHPCPIRLLKTMAVIKIILVLGIFPNQIILLLQHLLHIGLGL